MLHLALIPFMPAIKKAVVNYILPTLNGKEISETILKDLYHKLPPSISNLVEEKTFVEFGMKHKETLFGNTKPSKKSVKKKAVRTVKKPVKKLALKKKIKKSKSKAK